MEENLNPISEPQGEIAAEVKPEAKPEIKPEAKPAVKAEPMLIARGRELIFAGVTLLLGILLCNFLFYGGANLAFGIAAGASILWAWLYLKKTGSKFGGYEKCLLFLSLLICLGFGRTNDGATTFTMLLFLFVAVNLALCIGAGQNRRNPQGAMSLLDAFRAFYRLGIGNAGQSAAGLSAGIKQGGESTRRIGAVGTGLLVSVPILAIMIGLLVSADAAFEGLMDLLPEFNPQEYTMSGIWGTLLAWVLYTRSVSLAKGSKPMAACPKTKGVNPLTVNTVLIMVSLVYIVYLVSQLAYFSGGLSGILPEEFTLAEYARRGFFEMSWLCAINLGILCLTVWLIRQEKLPRLTKITGTFLAAITLFLIVTASAKMFLYIGSYGLTWSRVTTEVTMLWLAITTVLVAIRLFLPKFGYMKAVVLTAMVLGALVFWVDVEVLVSNYNVRAYRSGGLETVDVSHLDSMGAAAVPRLLELTEDKDPEVAEAARQCLNRENPYVIEDFRDWNYTKARADALLREYQAEQEQAIRAEMLELLGLDLSGGTILRSWGSYPDWQDGKRMVRVKFEEEGREAITAQLTAAQWAAAPVNRQMLSVLNRDEKLFKEFRDVYLNNSEKAGFWYFRDLHPDAGSPEDPSQLLLREEYNFVLVFYNSKNGCFYIFQVDKAAEPQTA